MNGIWCRRRDWCRCWNWLSRPVFRELIGEHVELPSTRVRSGAVNPAGKLTSIIAGMMCGADSIDDVNVLRAGGTPRVFDEVYAPSTLGIFLREFTFGHANQLAAVAPPASGGAGAAGTAAGGHRAARVFGHRLAAAPGLRDQQTRRLVRACQDRRPGAAAPGSVPADHHDVDGDRAAGDRRGVAALGGRPAPGAPPPASSSRPSPPPASATGRHDHGCAATRRSAPRR